MEGPLLSIGMVTAQNADTGELTVILRTSGSVPGTIKVGYNGPADALRIKQTPLPGRGTWGLIAFPYGDIRNGIWICAVLPTGTDAITATSLPGSGTGAFDQFIDYDSHFSGAWNMLTGSGAYAKQYADQSYFTAGPASGLPTITRHVVSGATRTKQVLPFAQRVKSVLASGFVYQFHHMSGTTITIDATGGISLTGVGTLNLASSGVLNISASGNVNVTSTATVAINGATEVDLVGSSKTFRVGGSSLGHLLAKADAVASSFNSHIHTAPAGGGPTTGPSTNMSSVGSDSVSVGS